MATINGTPGRDNLFGTSGPDFIYGLEGDDYIDGSSGIDSLFGGDGNDTFYTAHNIDTVDGGPGIDTVQFARLRGEHEIVKTSTGYTVYDFDSSADYTGVERFRFTDKKLAFDLRPGESAANTVLVIGAAFGAAAIRQHPDWVTIGLRYFDTGQTLAQVCAQVAQILALGHTDFVRTIYRNVVGVEPDAATVAHFVGMLQSGTTQAQLLELAATVDVNAVTVGLVGLQSSGVEFA